MRYELDNNVTNPPVSDYDDLTDVTYVYRGQEFPAKLVSERYVRSDGLSFQEKCGLVSKAVERGIKMTTRAARELYRAEHAGKLSKFYDDFPIRGGLKCPTEPMPGTLSEIQTAFANEARFHGRVPRIVSSIAAAADFYGLSTDVLVNNFSIPTVQAFLNAGTSGAETTLLYAKLDGTHLSQLSSAPQYGFLVAKLLEKSILAKKEKKQDRCRKAALWICEHVQSNPKLLQKVAKRGAEIDIEADSTIDFVNTQLSGLKSLTEIERLEKRYKKCHFKFKDCICELKFSETEHGRYRAEILQATDPRQVMLGQNTNCCQYLDGIGESAMMHGLLNPKAGFWILTNKESGKVLAQAEIWEENENSLVFDNIEFANDADISLYRMAIGKWLEECRYDNVKMGAGYNQLVHITDQFRACRPIKPSVTPYEIYVISHEEESEAPIFDSVAEAREALESRRVTYFDYVYCDSENRAFWMKERGRVEPYFSAPEREEDRREPSVDTMLDPLDAEEIEDER